MKENQLRTVLAELAKTVDTATMYDAISSVYDELYEEENDLKENSQIGAVLRHVRGQKILDIGCGSGLLLRMLNLAPRDYLGIDISKGMINKAKHNYPHHIFLQDNLVHLSTVNLNSIDYAISLFECYNYIKDPAEIATAIRNLHLRLKKDGKIFIMLLTPDHPAKNGNHVIWPVGKDVLRTFNERQAHQLFQPYFKKLEVKYFPPASGKNYITVTGVKK
tara:strand:- start:379 stop:1038 length:660 start_codon:yes stop_codon:yes gene_type:complete